MQLVELLGFDTVDNIMEDGIETIENVSLKDIMDKLQTLSAYNDIKTTNLGKNIVIDREEQGKYRQLVRYSFYPSKNINDVEVKMEIIGAYVFVPKTKDYLLVPLNAVDDVINLK